MKSTAAVLWGVGQKWNVEEIEISPPGWGEVLVEWKAAGLCHSDEHFVTGDMVLPEDVRTALGQPDPFPIIGGHEGAGVVLEVGQGVRDLSAGDFVAASFMPACGRCRYCVTGRQNLCQLGAKLMLPGQIGDGVVRHFCRGEPLNLYSKCGTFSRHTLLSELSVVKVDSDLPPAVVALVSCGVATGWGSAVHRAGTVAGDVVVVAGCGGVGMNAIQGAAAAGARVVVAVDPVRFKRDMAPVFGATHVCATMSEAIELVRDMTWGQMADRVILAPGVMHGDLMADAMTLTGNGGTCVVTGVAPILQAEASVNLFQLAMFNKEIKGTIYGSGNPRFDIPNLLALYRAGKLKLEELVTTTYVLEDVNQGYEDMREGRNIRGVIVFD
jgi:S-(hydroxymethyl)glutathione dehydrogenase/alcohol dehydrogenase